MQAMSDVKTVEWVNGRVRMIDQTRIPEKFTYVTYNNYRQVAIAIKKMVVRGAPAIGVAAAMGIALAANSSKTKDRDRFMNELQRAADILSQSRPTAWNLFWAVERMLRKARQQEAAQERSLKSLLRRYRRLHVRILRPIEG